MSKSSFTHHSKTLLPYAIGFCALALLTSCGSRSNKAANGGGAPAGGAPTQAIGQPNIVGVNNNGDAARGDLSALGREFDGSGASAQRGDLSALDPSRDNGATIASRDASRATDAEARYMQNAQEKENQRAAILERHSRAKNHEVMDTFIHALGNDDANRGLRDNIYKQAKDVRDGKSKTSKKSGRVKKIHEKLESLFEASLEKTIGGVKHENCQEITAQGAKVGLVMNQDLIYSCVTAQGVSYELNYAAYEGMKGDQPVAGFEIAHIETSASDYQFRGQKAELRVTMTPSRAQVFKGANKRAAICITYLNKTFARLQACDQTNNPNGGGDNHVVCSDGNGGGNGNCNDVVVEGTFIGGCDEDPCDVDRFVNKRGVYRVVPGAPEAPRSSGNTTVTIQVPAKPATVAAPVVTQCAPVVDGGDCEEQSTQASAGGTDSGNGNGDGGTTPATTPGTVPGTRVKK